MQDDEQVPGADLEDALTKYSRSISELIRMQTDAQTKIIEAVREYLNAYPMGNEDLDKEQIAAPANQTGLPAFGRLVDNASGLGQLGQMLSLQMLAAVIRWFSIESGRSEAEILDRLGPSDFENFGKSVIADVTRAVRDMRHDNDA